MQTFDSSYFSGKNYFDEGGTQNYLVFIPTFTYFKVNSTNNVDYISTWQSKGLSSENIKLATTSDNSPTPPLNYYGTKIRVTFTRSCLKQSKVSYTHGKVVNIYIVNELGAFSFNNSDPTIKKLFIW